jgi:hypothetical protein
MSWQDRILKDFPAGAYALAIVGDRHQLFTDQKLRSQLSARGYQLIFYGSDSIKFRYEYEQLRAKNLPIMAIVPLDEANIFNKFPYDILTRASFRNEYGLNDLFPNLNEIVLAQFNSDEWEQLYISITNYPNTPLGEKATQFFLHAALSQSPLPSPLPSATTSITQLQLLLKNINNGYQLSPNYQINRPITNDLQPIYDQLATHLTQWQTQPPTYKNWLDFAPLWGKAIVTRYATINTPEWEHQSQLDTLFSEWIQQNYDKLHNLSFIKSPITLDKIAHFLSRQIENKSAQKIALIVFDGMGWDSWLILEKLLDKRNDKKYKIKRSSCFAMLPTLTSISRQSIFAGKLPQFYADSLKTTSKEPIHWRNFWLEQNEQIQGQNWTKDAIAYLNVRGNPTDLENISASLAHPKQKALGLVVSKIDDIAHGMTLGTQGLHQQTKQWAEQGFFQSLVDFLSDRGYQIYITADHGMIEATGMGRINEGVFVEQRGERVRIYSDEALSQTACSKYPHALFWQSRVLPDYCQPLFAPPRIAFVESGDRLMCHGGISIEEVIIPFIEISPVATP